MTTADALRERWDAVMMPNYGTPPVALARGEGCRVWDVDGAATSTCIGGIAVSALGHAHPAVVDAVRRQVGDARPHQQPVRARAGRRAGRAAGRPARRRRPGVLLQLRRRGQRGGVQDRPAARLDGRPSGRRLEVVAAEGGFHGRTMGALSLTGNPSKREPFAPLPGPVTFVPYGDVDALRAAVTDRTAAVFLEPTLGEGGVVPPPPATWPRRGRSATRPARCWSSTRCRAGSAGPGTGSPTRPRASGPTWSPWPRGSAAGMPIGACIGFGAAGELLTAGQHGSTFGGNPVVLRGRARGARHDRARRPARLGPRGRRPARRRPRPAIAPAGARACAAAACGGRSC